MSQRDSLESGGGAEAPTRGGSWVRAVTTACALYAAVGGAISFLGWPLDLPRLTDWAATGVSIQPNAALLISLGGAGLLLIRATEGRLTSALGALVALVGGATLLQYVVGADFGLNHQLLFGRTWGQGTTVTPGRVGPPASTSFALLGASLVVLASRAPWALRSRRFVPIAGLAVCAVMTLGLSGFLFGARSFYAIPWLTAIALQTASMLIALGLAVIASVPDAQPMRLLTSRSTAGIIARRVTPMLVFLPLVLGWLRMRGETMGLYDTGTGRSLLVVGLILLGVTMLWWPLTALAAQEESERSARHAARQSEAVFRTLGETIPDLLWMTDAEGSPLFQNRAWENYAAIVPGDTSGDDLVLQDGADEGEPVRLLWAEARSRGRAFRFETRLRRHDGELRWFTGRTVPLTGQDGTIQRWVGALTDVHALKAAEEALRETDRRKDQFLATLAHELRNPLAPLRSGLEVLRLTSDPGILEEARSMMERQLSSLVRLVDDLLDLQRINRGKIELRLRRISLAQVVQIALETAQPIIEARRHEVSVRAPADPMLVDADGMRLAQVFANLLDNAAKYTEEGGRITVALEREGDRAVVRIIDSGAGIPPEMLTRIFDRFVQVGQEPDEPSAGLGIGLSLVKELVRLHGGEIEARSDGRGRGSEFIVRLPMTASDSPAVLEKTTEPGLEGRPSSRVLVVDDNRDTATSLALLVEMLGHETETAYDGSQALSIAQSFRPDIILLDVGMPKMDGYEVCRRIRQQPWSESTTVVACTGWGQEEDKRRTKEAGFDHHLVKPVDPAALNALLSLQRPSHARAGEAPHAAG